MNLVFQQVWFEPSSKEVFSSEKKIAKEKKEKRERKLFKEGVRYYL